MRASPFFSIIVPVYNSEKYLVNAVTSIQNQTYSNFELILIDDCSTDKSYELCREISDKYVNTILLKTRTNSGASVARNLGLNIAQGKYITFVDADDYIEPDMLMIAYQKLKQSPVDCLKVGYWEEYFDKNAVLKGKKKIYPKNLDVVGNSEVCRYANIEDMSPIIGYLWNGYYRKEIIKKWGIFFDESILVNEDFLFITIFLQRSNSLSTKEYCGYHYERRQEMSLSKQIDKFNYHAQILKTRCRFNLANNILNCTDFDLKNPFWQYVRTCYFLLERSIQIGENKKHSFLKQWNEITQDSLYKRCASYPYSKVYDSVKKKIAFWLILSNKPIVVFYIILIIHYVKYKFPYFFEKIKN